MANDEHVAILKQGINVWNKWRKENLSLAPDLSGAKLGGADLRHANLSGANLVGADLSLANLDNADLSNANANGANLSKAAMPFANVSVSDLRSANLKRARLFKANLVATKLEGSTMYGAILHYTDLAFADLRGADLRLTAFYRANLEKASLCEADLREASLFEANLRDANFSGANLSDAILENASMVNSDFSFANLTGCHVHGISAWNLQLEGTKQQDLIITPGSEPDITVDNIEVAQFIYLMLNNPKIRDIIDTIGRKAVLILGRFTPERKAVLDALREELRKSDYVPILFDFDRPASQDLTATVSTLAHLARFIIADLTDPSSVPFELATVVPTTPIPVQPILLTGCREFAMFQDLPRKYHWVLPTHHYDTPRQLIADLEARVIRPAETKVLELRGP
jgi:uncharacterized protein YjbI with pentapeptide repeats